MSMPTRRKRQLPRSREGCQACRQHHQKCDEKRPICGLCQRRRRDCVYTTKLSWGGRAFDKSIFGQCMQSTRHRSTSVIRVSSASQDHSQIAMPFVYGVDVVPEAVPAPASLSSSTISDSGAVLPLTQWSIGILNAQRSFTLRKAIPLFPQLSPNTKCLLDYFFHVADTFSCDEKIKVQFCAALLPLAAKDFQLMCSILSLAAVHRANAGLAQSSEELATLRVLTVKHMRVKLLEPPNEAFIASVLMLCYTELISGREKSYSWRSHLEGVALLFACQPARWTIHSPDSTRAFISRCFVSLAALCNVSGCPPSDAITRQVLSMVGERTFTPLIDDFTSYSVDLVHVFFQIGTLMKEKEWTGNDDISRGFMDVETRSLELIQQLAAMIGTRNLSTPPNCNQEYSDVNESYHLAAMLQIHQQIRGMSSNTNEIQNLVDSILSLLCKVNIHPGPCRGVLLFFPAFSAGCGAVSAAHRQQVRDILRSIIGIIGFVNIQQGLALLEALWSHRDQHGECDININWTNFIDVNVDMILY